MSYIRAGYPLVYVDGNSTDYVFCTEDGNGNESIEDYGSISNESIIEILANRFLNDDKTFRDYLIPILAERLSVKLRIKPLSSDEQTVLMNKIMDEYHKEHPEWFK